jgi:predicted membrane metal-binding protein
VNLRRRIASDPQEIQTRERVLSLTCLFVLTLSAVRFPVTFLIYILLVVFLSSFVLAPEVTCMVTLLCVYTAVCILINVLFLVPHLLSPIWTRLLRQLFE